MLLAELGIALAGFTALLVVFRVGPGERAAVREAGRALGSVPLILVFAAVVPLLLLRFSALSQAQWRICSSVLLLVWLLDFATTIYRVYRDDRGVVPKPGFIFTIAIMTASFALIGSNVVGLFANAEAGYILGLLGPLAIATRIFYAVLRTSVFGPAA